MLWIVCLFHQERPHKNRPRREITAELNWQNDIIQIPATLCFHTGLCGGPCLFIRALERNHIETWKAHSLFLEPPHLDISCCIPVNVWKLDGYCFLYCSAEM